MSAFGGALLSPLAARAQTRPVIGFLHAGSPEGNERRVAAFRKGLAAGGFVEGRNIAIEYRWARGRNDDLPALAADLVRGQVALITTAGSTPAAIAAKKATAVVPIVFSSGTDPVGLGLVESLSRPGGNATGITSLNSELAAKRLGIFRALVPNVSRYFTLVNPSSELTAASLRELEHAAAGLGINIEVLNARTPSDISTAFAQIPEREGCGMMFGPDGFLFVHRSEIASLALARRLPTIFDVRDYVEAGGLASYGSDYYNVMELTGGYVARVLKGERPADLPVQQATKFEMVLNRKTATALRVEISSALLALADDVIE